MNALRDAMLSGKFTQADLQALQQQPNVLAEMLSQQPTFDEFSSQPQQRGTGFMETSDGRRMTFGRQVSDAPMAPREPQGNPNQAMPTYGFDSSTGTLQQVQAQGQDSPIDYSRSQVSIPGVGKGYYSKDGMSAYVPGPDGAMKKVLLGFDAERTRALQEFDLNRKAKLANIAQTEEQTQSSIAQRTRKETPTPPPGYRWTATGELQAIPGGPAEEVNEKRRMENDDRLNSKKSLMESGQMTLKQLDDLLAHPGLEGAVGTAIPIVDGMTMPLARFVPGTDAADFSSRLDQVKGGAFLEAFKALKGGGAITEIEGKKAESAITRMGLSQSEAEFKRAAQEYRGIVEGALQRMQGVPSEKPAAQAPRAGEVRQGYVFRGGNPADPASWAKVSA